MRRLLLVMLAACSGTEAPLALGEPVVVRGGSFFEGPLPGSPPDDTAEPVTPAITFVQLENNQVRLGQAGKDVAGRTSTDAVAVAIAFAGAGTGYWVSPVGPRDPTAGNEYTWTLDTSLGWDLPLGPGAFDVVAIDDAGRAGRQREISICVRPDLLDNMAACDASLSPPDTVVELEWDAPVDLDLWVLTPDGKLVSPANPTTISHDPPITQAELSAPGVGIIDRDSNAGCVIDGINREALVWQTPPAGGTYVVYANLSASCGQPAVSFSARVFHKDLVDGASRLVEVKHQEGRLLAGASNGGRGPGLYLMQLAL